MNERYSIESVTTNPVVGFQPLAAITKCGIDLLELIGEQMVPVVGLEPT